MNDTPTPLSREQTLELLSAELDGEFDAAAADLGLTPATARARLEVTPGVDDDRRALAGTLDSLDVPVLADETRAALVARALAEGRDELAARRSRASRLRPIISLAAVFAAVALGVGIVATMESDREDATTVSAGDGGDDGGGDAREETADEFQGGGGAGDDDAAATEEMGAQAPVASDATARYMQFGEVVDPEVLREQVLAAPPSGLDYESLPAPPDAAPTDLVGADCLAELIESFGLPGAPIMRGPATYDGEPADVLVFASGSDFEVLVVSAGCSVFNHQFISP